MATITVVDGTIELKDQLRDYQFRGEELTQMNFLSFMLETYEDQKDNNDEANITVIKPTDGSPNHRVPGRPPSARIPYQDEAGKGKRCRIKRLPGHETLPGFIGKWFCQSDSDNEKDLFRASMLMLLKPWRKLIKLKGPTETFENAYNRFISQTDSQTLRVVTNMQYYFECSDGAKAERRRANTRTEHSGPGERNGGDLNIDIDDNEEIDDVYAAIGNMFEEITEEDIERAQVMKVHPRERLYGEAAVALGYDVGFFEDTDISTVPTNYARKMELEEGGKIQAWEAQLKATTHNQIKRFGTIDITGELNEAGPSIQTVGPASVTTPAIWSLGEPTPTDCVVPETAVQRVELANLNEEQRRAPNIIEEKLNEHMTSELKKKISTQW